MDIEDSEISKKVFRVRGLPNDVKSRADAASLVSQALGLSAPSDVIILSLATTLDYWETSPTRVSTMQLNASSRSLGPRVRPGEWHAALGGSNEGVLILDTHFLGLTPLNDVDEDLHALDIIAISGLGSHPFGSWQPHGPDKSYMWIRDEIPGSVVGARAILYGYDTSLVDRDAFQSIRDIARGFFEQLRATGWHRDAATPLAFLAHSLGGIVLMEALLQIAGSRDNTVVSILDRVRGAVLFGVPTLGMEQSTLQTMTQNQLNEVLIQDLSRDSNYLRRLAQSYSGISKLRQLRVIWAYETRSSPTLERDSDGRWTRNGAHQIWVDRHSATYRHIDDDPQSTFPINRNHSDLVKFTRGDDSLRTVLSKLNMMLLPQGSLHDSPASPQLSSMAPSARAESSTSADLEKEFKDAIQSLGAPDLDARVTGIEDRFEKTLDWVFELQGFTTWLQHGTGIFWISGKPGSGKSTLMKFIAQNSKTRDLIHDFQHRAQEITASFFFHFRGSAMQKSFEGVLRSLINQILENVPSLFSILKPILPPKKKGNEVRIWTILGLEQCLMALLEQNVSKIDMCLFFDALDEFDGHHSFICSFLKRLVNLRPASLTRVKLCFSSRPWDIFTTNFGDCRGFKIQDHTESDIRDYCIHSLSHEAYGIGHDIVHVEELVLDIIARAEGVFLWVKLVLAQLVQQQSQQHPLSLADMQETIRSLPTELDDFYIFIIDRIPRALRWQTYALLDILIRANDEEPSEVSALRVFDAVRVSDCRTYKQAHKRFHSIHIPSFDAYITNWSGGLAEIVRSHPRSSVQLMHQTVHQFVKSDKFKERVLGDLAAKITRDNGHTFLAKVHLLNLLSWIDPDYHLLSAEATTGRSLFTFIESMPVEEFHTAVRSMELPDVSRTLLGFAASLGLQLFIKDATRKSPSGFPEPHANLLECVLRGHNSKRSETVACLLQNGFPVHEDIGELWSLFWKDLKPQFASLGRQERDFALALIKGGWKAEQTLQLNLVTTKWALGSVAGYGRLSCSGFTLLHIALPSLSGCLLSRGFNPNALDSSGCTPLDWVLRSFYNHGFIAEKARVLVAAGGRPRMTKKPIDWHFAEEFLSSEQLDEWAQEGWVRPLKLTLIQSIKERLSRARG